MSPEIFLITFKVMADKGNVKACMTDLMLSLAGRDPHGIVRQLWIEKQTDQEGTCCYGRFLQFIVVCKIK